METLYQYSISQQDQQALPNTPHHVIPCDCFIFHLHFTHQLQLLYPQATLIPFESIQDSFFIPFDVFFSHTHEAIVNILSGTGVSDDFLHALVPEVHAFAMEVLVQDSANARDKIVPLDLAVMAVTPFDDRDRIVRAIMESGQARNPVPAAKSCVDGLKKVKIENLSVVKECSICLEEFLAGREVVIMPCSHLYHKDCIFEWLKRSHLCPYCRYKMPT